MNSLPGTMRANTAWSGQVSTRRVFCGFGGLPFRRRFSALPRVANASR
jgi:hypothetical protein